MKSIAKDDVKWAEAIWKFI